MFRYTRGIEGFESLNDEPSQFPSLVYEIKFTTQESSLLKRQYGGLGCGGGVVGGAGTGGGDGGIAGGGGGLGGGGDGGTGGNGASAKKATISTATT
jgi:hypothetical protein